MGRGNLSTEEMRLLRENPHVAEINNNRIIYTNEFKQHFMEEYLTGKGPTKIFREAGLMPEILGSKRIERAAARWREAYFAGSLGAYQDGSIRHREILDNPELTKAEKEKLTARQAQYKLSKKQKQIQMLREENVYLKKQLRLMQDSYTLEE